MEPSLLFPGLSMQGFPVVAPPGSISRQTSLSPTSAASQCLICRGSFTSASPCVVLCIEGHCTCRLCALSMTHCPLCNNIIIQPGGILPEQLFGALGEEGDPLISPIDEYYYAQVLAKPEQESYGAGPFDQLLKRPRLSAGPQFNAAGQPPGIIAPELNAHNPINSLGIGLSMGLPDGSMSIGATGIAAPPPLAWPLQRKKPSYPPELMPRCASGHKLQPRKFFPDKFCAVCNHIIKKLPGRKCFYCRKCDYMLCLHCTPAPYKCVIPFEGMRQKSAFLEPQAINAISGQSLPPITTLTRSTPSLIAPAPLSPSATLPDPFRATLASSLGASSNSINASNMSTPNHFGIGIVPHTSASTPL